MDEVQGIGLRNRLPWHLSADQKRFKELTLGHTLIVGRKTFESIGRPLPGRKMIVVSRDRNFRAEGIQAAGSLDKALELARQAGETEVFIAGGAAIYAQTLPLADRIYLTRVQAVCNTDTFFPPIDLHQWKEQLISQHEADDKNEYPFTFSILERVREG